jgi:hypothetical protein
LVVHAGATLQRLDSGAFEGATAAPGVWFVMKTRNYQDMSGQAP